MPSEKEGYVLLSVLLLLLLLPLHVVATRRYGYGAGTVQRVVDREKQNYIPTLKRLCNDVSSLKRAARKRAGTQDRGSTDQKRQKRVESQ